MSYSPEQFDGFADLVQGRRAVLTRVGLHLTDDGLALYLPDGEVEVWPWSDLRALRDQADRKGLVLFLKGAKAENMARLSVRDAELSKTLRTRASALNKRSQPLPLKKLTLWAAGAVASVAAIIFVLVPLMAAQLAAILPPEGEKALGDTTLTQIRQVLGEADMEVNSCHGAEGAAALDHLRTRLLPKEGLPYPVEVHVLDHDLVNAFALPGGHVILFRGLIEAAESPDEVTAVLAHEIGHVVHRDPTRDALRSAGSIGVLGLLFGDFAGGTVALMLANQLINASYSQAAETAADEYAHKVLEREKISPAALGTFFQRLKDEHGDAEGFLAHLSTHPQLEKRILAAGAATSDAQQYAPSLSGKEWVGLQQICGPRRGLSDGTPKENAPADDRAPASAGSGNKTKGG